MLFKKTVNPRKRKEALERLESIFKRPDKVLIIHYSCESFYDRQTELGIITSIAIMNLNDGQTLSFSLLRRSEIQKIPLLSENYNTLEKEMLSEYFEYIKQKEDCTFLHWNMRDEIYGFHALELKQQIHEGSFYKIQDDKKLDLSSLLVDLYGSEYIGHPRFFKLIEKNKITNRDILSGQEEAQAFNESNFKALHLSTLRKVGALRDIASRIYNNQLTTNSNFFNIYGGSLIYFLENIKNKPIIVIIALVFAFISYYMDIDGLISLLRR